MGIWGVFLVPLVQATTIYQQLTDSSGAIQLDNVLPPYTLVATFQSPVSESLSADAFVYLVVTNLGINALDIALILNDSLGATQASFSTGSGGAVPVSDGDQFLEIPIQSGAGNNLIAGETYTLYADINTLGSVSAAVRANYSDNFLYGYITNNGVESVPVAPGIPGFTDVGIATTSQQVYCNANFSSTTGFLDSIGLSISQGFCNVGVFLFVPSSQAVSQWQGLSSTTQVRIPFSYFYGLKSIYSSYVATTSPSFLDVSINTGAFPSSTLVALPASWTVFSTSTLGTFAYGGFLSLARTLMSYSLWLLFAWFIFFEVKNLHTRKHS